MLCSVLLAVLASLAFVFAEDDDSTMALKFLGQYHYISPTRSGNHDVKTAIENFQSFTGLPVTGKLDKATIKQMKSPRCGMPDVDEDGRVKRYKTSSKWSKKQLTYFVEYGADLSQAIQDKVFAKALKYWSDTSGLTFSKASSASAADLKISFGSKTHRGSSERQCAYPFDGPGKVLAHVYYPSDGRAHFDEDERFTDSTSSGTNLLWVATHEFGHALGIRHSDVRNAVMYPYYTGYVANFKLQADDIAAIQSLYGKPASGGNGACTDKSSNCKYWTRYCSYHSYVIENCKKTCNLCSCTDKNSNCPKWTRYCSYHSYVKANCKKTCKLC